MSARRQDVLAAALAIVGDTAGCLVHGWRLSGPGPARYGWWWQGAAGDCTLLGKTAAEVKERAPKP